MFKKVLIANRGEIALRIIRACKELGIGTVAVYSEADRDSLHVRFADEEVCIGRGPASESYLHMQRILAAAEITNADAIHPGYGFLAENAEFSEICAHNGFVFIGPTVDNIRKMGDKASARSLMIGHGIPVIPGTESILDSEKQALAMAAGIGYPVMIKASAGGGGKGMRVVHDEKDLPRAFAVASSEAASAFGNPGLYLEKYLIRPRHVEFQVLGDRFGNVVHLGERDCSVQRRHQKLIEESPCPAMTPALRRKMGECAVEVARLIEYVGAGTVEFLLDKDMNFYFMEMNTRIQVEHPVTEMVTGLDLVKEQVAVSGGERFSFDAGKVKFNGHAIECRINAEDPRHDFRPCPGVITSFHPPGGPGIRVDTHIYASYVVPPFYDSLLAKLIAHGRDRSEAIARLRRSLDEFIIIGVPTTIDFHRTIIDDPRFISGDLDIQFLEKRS
ncbi:MAG: acetyl-CoA carboxylase biotin carboxylase subunit [Candidatus Glassbacteria bacterium]|nr:acetyl-CoA carboxylase biotin carboxylase subunit [Candidatus Glassbacteria bacterium]